MLKSFLFRITYPRFSIKSHWLIAILVLYFATILNLTLWRFVINTLVVTDISGIIFVTTMPVFVLTALYLLFSLFLWPYFGKPFFIVLLLISSAANYFMFYYGVFIDTNMITNVFQTNQREALDLITLNAFTWIFFTGVIPAVLLFLTQIQYRPIFKEIGFRIVGIAVCGVIITIIAAFFYKDYAAYGRNNRQINRLINPVNYIDGVIKYITKQVISVDPFGVLDPNAQLVPYEDHNNTVFVLIIGETARSMNFSLNGYSRQTNPFLEKEDVISFSDVTASGTSTAVSVPCMFSHLPRNECDPVTAKNTENLLDVFQKAGYQILWLENDDGCKGVCLRVPHKEMVEVGRPALCEKDSCFDEVMLEHLDKYLKTVDQDTVIVLHLIGSHGPTYYKRYPDNFRLFTPTCDTADLQKCSRQKIINTYDNTIAYSDYVISKAIGLLKQYPNFEAGLLYVSDHGESLGENGLYLHGVPYTFAPKEQTQVPMILWMSEVMKKEDHINYECMKEKVRHLPLAHDNLFHSLLGLMEIKTELYNQEHDFFHSCRTKPLPH